jgi:hypothetical protein
MGKDQPLKGEVGSDSPPFQGEGKGGGGVNQMSIQLIFRVKYNILIVLLGRPTGTTSNVLESGCRWNGMGNRGLQLHQE